MRAARRAVRGRKPTTAWSLAREVVIVVVGALVISTLLRVFVGQMFIIPSDSMQHTLERQDRVAVSKLNTIRRGQVVVFEDPANWLGDESTVAPTPWQRLIELVGYPTDASTSHLIKRAIGLPGDHVVCCDEAGRITVNGQALDETAYLYRDGDVQVKPSELPFDVVVPAGHIWVMGDHRDDSADSRYHLADPTPDGVAGSAAFVPESDVVGPAFAIVLPLSRATILHVPDTFSHVPDPTGAPPAEPIITKR